MGISSKLISTLTTLFTHFSKYGCNTERLPAIQLTIAGMFALSQSKSFDFPAIKPVDLTDPFIAPSYEHVLL